MVEDDTTLGVKFERAICAAALCWPSMIDELPTIPEPEDFLSPGAGEVWTAIVQCWRERKEVSVARVSQIVNELGFDLKIAGRVANYADPSLCDPQDAPSIATWLKARTLMHRAMGVASEFRAEMLAAGVSKAPEVVDRFARHLADVASGGSGAEWTASFAADVADTILAPDNGYRRVPTGWCDIDDKIRGWPRGKLSIVAGRPSMGKSLFGLCAARQMAQRGLGVGIVSLEMDEDEVWIRLACDLAYRGLFSPEYETVQAGKASPIQVSAMRDALADLRRLPIGINDKSGLKVADIYRWARGLDRRYQSEGRELDALIVDYLQLTRPEKDRNGSKVNEVTDISADMVAMAKDLGCATIAMSQLSRASEKRESQRPVLSDLRESGALEQDADMVGMLFRPAYYFERKAKEESLSDAEISEARRTRNHLDIDWQKNRNGKTGITTVFCAVGSNAVRDLSPVSDARAA